MKQTNLFFLILIFLTLSCKKTTENSNELTNSIESKTVEKKFVPKFGKLYFDYDEIEYYHNNIEEDSTYSLAEKQNSKIERLKNGIILGELPRNLTEQNFGATLEKIGFSKSPIDKSKFGEINKIFVEKTVNQAIDNSCIPIYRDILLFKNRKKIVGIAKICFTCDQNSIIGTKSNTENFGQDGDYEKLKNLLKH